VDLDLNGKVAVVTGAGKGIGLAVTMALAGEGAHVVAGSRSTGSLDGLKGVTPVAIDLSAAEGPAQLIQRAIEEHGQVDVLVNNVGAVRMRTEGFLGTSDEDFAWAMQMKLLHRPAGQPGRAHRDGRTPRRCDRQTSPRSMPSSSPTRPRSTTVPRKPRWSTSPRPSRRSSAREG
jgi:NAD(P)-dependent dehydrogenase (short-subunit alcohol dehydrogenase family)